MADEHTSPEPTLEEGGAYELIRQRLLEQGQTLGDKAKALNDKRLALFGGTQMGVIGSVRVRTENNCVPRDIASVGGYLLFGYNVYIGLKTETAIHDVFSLHTIHETEQGLDITEVPLQGIFLDDPQFRRDFKELYTYYKESRLTHLRVVGSKLLAVFRTGRSRGDQRVFRWSVDVQGQVTYIDNRGERDNVFPPSHDFEWTYTTRENHISGRHPHVSIQDKVFVETVGGDLTIKVEDNTEDGLGIYREPVEDPNQSLADAQIQYASLGSLVLLKVRPYREEHWRYLVFNTRTQQVRRIDALGQACVQLPEDHGLIFPGGYYLQNGETKTFEGEIHDLEFQQVIRSPNGEDVLYVFHHYEEGRMVLLSYNLIRKELQNPIHCHGYSLFQDGRLVVFRAESEEPTRVHPMQIWQTPYVSDEYAAQAPVDDSFLAKVGNADLVRGISDAYSIRRMIEAQEPSLATYEDLIAAGTRMTDSYYWLDHPEVGDLLSTLEAIHATAELVLNEFEKVQAMRQQAAAALAKAQARQDELLSGLHPERWETVQAYVDHLSALRTQRGRLITLRELRYIDTEQVDALEQAVIEKFDWLGRLTVDTLLGEEALAPYHAQIETHSQAIEALSKGVDAEPIQAALDKMGEGLDLVSEVLGTLRIEDATQRTQILERISEVFAQLNRAKATLQIQRKELRSGEAVAEFAAQFKLFSQSVTSALGVADTPERCDEQLSRLLVQLEELEARFSDFDEFIGDLAAKREEVYEAFEARKQALLEERQRRAQNLYNAAERILQGIARRAQGFQAPDELNTYLASDAMVLKVRDLIEQLRALDDRVRADDVEARLKASHDQALRALRDKQDIFEAGGAVIRLGRHRFSVNTQPLDLTLLPLEETLAVHLTGTDYFQPIQDPELERTREYWPQELLSETPEVYRGEYLAASLLFAAEEGRAGLNLAGLQAAKRRDAGLLEEVRRYAAARYEEGYERGVHDMDAALILDKLLDLRVTVGLLRFGAMPRALAGLFWSRAECSGVGEQASTRRVQWQRRAASLGQLAAMFGQRFAESGLVGELAEAIQAFFTEQCLEITQGVEEAAAYLVEELKGPSTSAEGQGGFITRAEAVKLTQDLRQYLDDTGRQHSFADDLQALEGDLSSQYELAQSWLHSYAEWRQTNATEEHVPTVTPELISEAAAVLLTEGRLDRQVSAVSTRVEVTGLLGQHPRIHRRTLVVQLDELLARLHQFRAVRVPGFRAYRQLRQRIIERERAVMRLSEFQPQALTAFVRNRLIDEVYLPLVGDNLAKQMGALGAEKRTDLMGMLLLISPPGYGKTTLMEYVAQRLGLVFMKVNGPAIGHQVTSIDPAEATNAGARQELEKLNLALEMGSNVMLYVDDIQHTHPEFLQKFIALSDAQRKMEGIWRGQARTYDLRGKRFCVVMAGNPYTESGEVFKIPDMLANRADIYNLGDVLSGKEALFALSYIENALTSNAVLAPLASRDMQDVYQLVRLAQGEEVSTQELSYPYSGTELHEITAVLQKLFRLQEVVLKVNQQYIASAAQDDAYRTEPPFKLQGSYRNMNKLAEKIVAVMNAQELEALIDDHYVGEAQTLTTGAEENLLKLAELRGVMSEAQQARWEEVKHGYLRIQTLGGKEADPVTRITGQLGALTQQLEGIQSSIAGAAQTASHRLSKEDDQNRLLSGYLDRLQQMLDSLTSARLDVQVVNEPIPGLDTTLNQFLNILDGTLLPMMRSMYHKLTLDHSIWEKISEVEKTLKKLDRRLLVTGTTKKGSYQPFKERMGQAKSGDTQGRE